MSVQPTGGQTKVASEGGNFSFYGCSPILIKISKYLIFILLDNHLSQTCSPNLCLLL